MREKGTLDGFPTKEELEKNFEKEIKEILAYIVKYNPYDMLSYFYSDYKISYGKGTVKTECWEKSRTVRDLQQLILCIDKNKYKKQSLRQKDIDVIESSLKKIQTYVRKYEVVKDELGELTEEEKEYIIHSNCFKDWNGKRYDIFEVQHHKDLLNPLAEEFKETYNFEIAMLYKGIENIKYRFYIEFADNVNNLKDYIKTNKLKLMKNGTIKLPKNVLKKEEINIENKIKGFHKNIFGLELLDLQKITTWTTEFLNIFTNNIGDYKEFAKNITIENWNKLINKINYKPLIKIDNKYYILLHQSFYDNMDRSIMKGICDKLSSNQQEIRARFARNAEKVVAGYLKNILSSSDIYIKNFYNNNFENDILISYDDNIFIIEVKSGNFTPELASSDFESHKEALNNLICTAQQQITNIEKYLKGNNSVEIYDSNNKKTRNKKEKINFGKDTNIFKIIVNVENFNDIQARADKVDLLKLDKNTLVFCLDDLRVYSEYFKNDACLFIQYLFQRMKTIGNKNMDLSDELYHLGMWIENNFYNEVANQMVVNLEQEIKEKIGTVHLIGEDWMTELDA